MQGPFTERFVGGREHRHVEINKYDPTKESDFNNLDSRVNRPEAYRLITGYEFTGSTGTTSPWKVQSGRIQIVPPQYPELDTAAGVSSLPNRPKANRPRAEYVKRPLNIKNILMTTASLSQSISGTITHNRIGNYSKNYEVFQTAGRSQNDPFFQDQSFSFALNPETLGTRGRFPLESPWRKIIVFQWQQQLCSTWYWLDMARCFWRRRRCGKTLQLFHLDISQNSGRYFSIHNQLRQ